MSESLGFLAMCPHVGYKSASTAVTVDSGIDFFAEGFELKIKPCHQHSELARPFHRRSHRYAISLIPQLEGRERSGREF